MMMRKSNTGKSFEALLSLGMDFDSNTPNASIQQIGPAQRPASVKAMRVQSAWTLPDKGATASLLALDGGDFLCTTLSHPHWAYRFNPDQGFVGRIDTGGPSCSLFKTGKRIFLPLYDGVLVEYDHDLNRVDTTDVAKLIGYPGDVKISSGSAFAENMILLSLITDRHFLAVFDISDGIRLTTTFEDRLLQRNNYSWAHGDTLFSTTNSPLTLIVHRIAPPCIELQQIIRLASFPNSIWCRNDTAYISTENGIILFSPGPQGTAFVPTRDPLSDAPGFQWPFLASRDEDPADVFWAVDRERPTLAKIQFEV